MNEERRRPRQGAAAPSDTPPARIVPAEPTLPGVDRARLGTDDWWASSAWAALEQLAKEGRPFQAQDLTELGVPDPDHGGRWGALFRRARQRGLIEPCGFVVSSRPTRSGGLCRLWVGTALAQRRVTT